MATVTGFTAARMLDIENKTVVSGSVDGTGHLILLHKDGTTVDAGVVVGPAGPAITGSVSLFAGATAPTGAVLCDGAAYSRSGLYAPLFALIGTTYGVGDGSTTFNVPNAKGRVLVGRDAAQAEFLTRGQTGGAKTHTLLTAETPSHTHTATIAGSVAQGVLMVPADTASATNRYSLAIGGGAPALPTTAAGGGGAHNNLQPYLVMNYIIFL